jgi:nucleoside-diphosphate-sugar epimerase
MSVFLITGGAGFIGSNIVKYLVGKEETVKVFDNLSTGNLKNIENFLNLSNFSMIKADLTDEEEVKKAITGVDYILHQAAIPSVQRSIEHPVRSNDSNIKGTLNLLIAARDEKVKKLVYASSSSIYGAVKELPKREDMAIAPLSPYALTKYAGERYCQIFSNIYGLPTICLRYFNVFGPGQNPDSEYSAVIPKFIKLMLEGESPVIFGDGEQSRDFTYVDNVVMANILAAHSDVSGEVINIACGERRTVNKLIESLNNILDKNIEPIYKESRLGDVKHSFADITKAKQLLGFEAQIKFNQGLEKTIKFYSKD